MESQVRGIAPEKATQANLPPPSPPPFTQPLRPDPADHKRKKEQKGPKVVEWGKGLLSKETKPQKGAKQARLM